MALTPPTRSRTMKRVFPLMIATVALSAPAFAFGPPPPDADPEARLEKGLDVVDATDDQRSTIRSLFEETLPTLKGLHEEGRALHERMQDAFSAEVIDRAEVEGVRLDGLDLADRISATVLDLMVEAGNVLTQDQRLTLIEHHEAMREKRHEMVQHFRELRGAR
jgi:Spy/CpxP family protein refolding chaperone